MYLDCARNRNVLLIGRTTHYLFYHSPKKKCVPQHGVEANGKMADGRSLKKFLTKHRHFELYKDDQNREKVCKVFSKMSFNISVKFGLTSDRFAIFLRTLVGISDMRLFV